MWSIILKQIESCREAKIGISSMVNAYHNSLGSVISSNLCKCWVGQKVCSGFSIPSYWKTQTNILVNPIPCTVLGLVKKIFWSNNFYWTVVDLQYCVSFNCTAKWISYAYTYIPLSVKFWDFRWYFMQFTKYKKYLLFLLLGNGSPNFG